MVVKGEGKKRYRRSGLPQERGLRRRKEILTSALSLLGNHRFQDITYQSIANEANVPLASCYHFYKNKLDVVRALADELTNDYLDIVFDDSKYTAAKGWQDCIEIQVRSSVAHHNRSAAELQIFFSGDVPLALRQDALKREKVIGQKLWQLLKRRFEVPEIVEAENIFFRAIEIARTVLALDYQETGDLGEKSVIEAIRAVTGYLGNYLSPVLAPISPD
jgi:AcrR family transcriptional regulator